MFYLGGLMEGSSFSTFINSDGFKHFLSSGVDYKVIDLRGVLKTIPSELSKYTSKHLHRAFKGSPDTYFEISKRKVSDLEKMKALHDYATSHPNKDKAFKILALLLAVSVVAAIFLIAHRTIRERPAPVVFSFLIGLIALSGLGFFYKNRFLAREERLQEIILDSDDRGKYDLYCENPADGLLSAFYAPFRALFRDLNKFSTKITSGEEELKTYFKEFRESYLKVDESGNSDKSRFKEFMKNWEAEHSLEKINLEKENFSSDEYQECISRTNESRESLNKIEKFLDDLERV